MIVSPKVKASRLEVVEAGSLICMAGGRNSKEHYCLTASWGDDAYVIPIGPTHPTEGSQFPTYKRSTNLADEQVLDLGKNFKIVLPVGDVDGIAVHFPPDPCCGIIVTQQDMFLRVVDRAPAPTTSSYVYSYLKLSNFELDREPPAAPRVMFTRWKVVLTQEDNDIAICGYEYMPESA